LNFFLSLLQLLNQLFLVKAPELVLVYQTIKHVDVNLLDDNCFDLVYHGDVACFVDDSLIFFDSFHVF